MKAETPSEKRQMADRMAKDGAADLAHWFKQCAAVFGPSRVAYYNEEPPGVFCKPGLQEAKK